MNNNNNTVMLNICLSDIPKDKIRTGKNHKEYININLLTRNKTDDFGNDYCLTIPKSKEEIKADAPTVFVGNAKNYETAEKN